MRRACGTLQSTCSTCRSRSTCALVVGGDAHASFRALGGAPPSSSAALPPKSVFRRALPDALVAFSSRRGRQMFAEAVAKGHMEPYFPLAEQFVTQNEPTFCGLGTLTMVMNALRVDPRRRWHDENGPGWRWWSDEMFPTSCTGSLDTIRAVGTTMEEFRLLAIANGADVQMRRPTDPGESLESFRGSILEAACESSDAFTATSFCRATLGQTGGGHFSPIGGYHEGTDAALVLDVARFKYPPYWVPLEKLWEASLATDDVTGESRGWFTLSPASHLKPEVGGPGSSGPNAQ